MAGQRLDAALRQFWPQVGLRGARRAIAEGFVLCNGKTEKAAYKLRAGDRLEVKAMRGSRPHAAATPCFLCRQGEYIFVSKPADIHCVSLAGSPAISLEEILSEIVPADCGQPRLLQRLDYHTSGVVCAALSEEAVKAFRLAERGGQCEKFYLALLEGFLARPTTIRLGIDAADRRKSRIRGPTNDVTRWTEFLPLQHLDEDQARYLLLGLGVSANPPAQGFSLAVCRIRRGARHQIRAHAYALGNPLWGDALYGNPLLPQKALIHWQEIPASFFLHHCALSFPGGRCFLAPPWALPQNLAQIIQDYFAEAGFAKNSPGFQTGK